MRLTILYGSQAGNAKRVVEQRQVLFDPNAALVARDRAVRWRRKSSAETSSAECRISR